MIPILFGNKSTVEFRIHTPTFNANKVVNFIYMNMAIVDFTIENTSKILANPALLHELTLNNLILKNFRNKNCNGDLSRLHESLYKYIETRTMMTERQNKEGLIKGIESDINCPSRVNWLKKKAEPIDQGVLDYLKRVEEQEANIRAAMTRSTTESYIRDSLYNTSSKKVKPVAKIPEDRGIVPPSYNPQTW